MSHFPLLIEIGTEELPPENLDKLVDHFAKALQFEFEKAGIPFGANTCYCTPRRLAVCFQNVPSHTPARKTQKKGPTLASSFDAEKNPTKALLGFAKSCGVNVGDLKTVETPEGSWLVYESETLAQPISQLLGGVIQSALEKMPIPKRMRWGSNTFSFLRPIHWIMILHGETPIETSVYDLTSGNTTYGHRFHAPNPITIKKPEDYEADLKNAYVYVNHEARKASIVAQIERLALTQNCEARIDPKLRDLVTGLVEWPHALLATFSEHFLAVPQEALISSMQSHQKCFPLYDSHGKLKSTFVVISNVQPASAEKIIEGNERVMQARLADAQFFYQQDKKWSLSDRLDKLKSTVFQKKLGTLYDKSQRVAKLAHALSGPLQANAALCERAGLLCKADLSTDMIFEFPELQGIMGYYYALNDAEPEPVAKAILESYYPRYAKDRLPATLEGTVVALADRLDTLLGIFGIGQVPTGDKDPYALRRQALAILRIIIEKSLNLNLATLLLEAKHGYGGIIDEDTVPKLLSFCHERFRAWYQERGVSMSVIDAVLTHCHPEPYDCHLRMMAVMHFTTLPEAQSLSQANKRVRNILQKNETFFNSKQLPTLDESLLKEPLEKDLAKALLHVKTETAPLIAQKSYQEALVLMASLQAPVDAFFDKILVMADDMAVRKNRLILLGQLLALFSEVADISKLAL